MSLDTERFRFTGAQVHLIRPGLADLFAEYNYVACTGSLREPVVDKNGHPIPAQVPAVPQWAVIASALDKLYALNGRAVTMSVTSLELLAFILGVRLTERLLRLRRLPGWTHNHHQRARRLIRRLENDRRRALARYLEVHGPETYAREHLEWQMTVRALRRHLVPSDAAVQRMGVLSTENAGARSDTKGVGSLAEPVTVPSPTALLNLDLSFLEIEVPGSVAEDRCETAMRPSNIRGNQAVHEGAAEKVCRLPSDPAVAQRLQVLSDRDNGEYSKAVAQAVIDVLEQAPDLFARDRRSVAEHLARCLVNGEPREYADIFSAGDIDAVLRDCKPRRSVALDGPTTLNFYMSWLLTAMDRLAPVREIRERVSRIVQAHDFVPQGRSILLSDSGVRT